MHEPDFDWPDRFAPAEATLYIRNALVIDAPVETVWAWLIAAPLWPEWFPSASRVRLDDGDVLTAGARFRWSQSGLALDTTVREFVPFRRLAWYAVSPLIRAYHAWDLSERDGATSVVTDESQRGIMPTVLGFAMRGQMLALHDRWLAALARQAAHGVPPDR